MHYITCSGCHLVAAVKRKRTTTYPWTRTSGCGRTTTIDGHTGRGATTLIQARGVYDTVLIRKWFLPSSVAILHTVNVLYTSNGRVISCTTNQTTNAPTHCSKNAMFPNLYGRNWATAYATMYLPPSRDIMQRWLVEQVILPPGPTRPAS